jgi:hypothetical protein
MSYVLCLNLVANMCGVARLFTFFLFIYMTITSTIRTQLSVFLCPFTTYINMTTPREKRVSFDAMTPNVDELAQST